MKKKPTKTVKAWLIFDNGRPSEAVCGRTKPPLLDFESAIPCTIIYTPPAKPRKR